VEGEVAAVFLAPLLELRGLLRISARRHDVLVLRRHLLNVKIRRHLEKRGTVRRQRPPQQLVRATYESQPN
jgi:hypothetical protein